VAIIAIAAVKIDFAERRLSKAREER